MLKISERIRFSKRVRREFEMRCDPRRQLTL
jgi:hypothetical protein